MSGQVWSLIVLGLLTLTACGGSSGGGSSTTGPSVPAPAGLTISITSAGVAPKSLMVSAGSQVTFTNGDVVLHEMYSDPHPDHTDCPEINQVGFLNPGQSRTSGNLNVVRSCGFHDHDQPTNAALQGTVVIQ